MDKNYEVTIIKMVYGGDGFARLPDGRAVFVPFVLPGEEVRIQITQEKKNFAHAVPVEILSASEMRISPRCAHFTKCGGCHYQHLDYQDQLSVKQEVFAEQLERIGAVESSYIQPIRPSKSAWNYRNTIQFHLSKDGRVGYQAAKSQNLVPISECHLPQAGINAVWPQLTFQPEMNLERIEFVEGTEEELMLVLQSEEIKPPELSLDLPMSVVHHSPGGEIILAGDDYVLFEVGEKTFSVSAGSFFQVNSGMVEELVNCVISNASPKHVSRVIDLFCGVGLFSVFLAPQVEEIIGVEISPTANQDFILNLDPYDNVTLYEGAVEQVLPGLEFDADIILLDPPRSGLHRKVIDKLARMKPDTLVYVSCDPSTLARDLKRLREGGYQLETIIPIDLFPQTYHIESVSILKKN